MEKDLRRQSERLKPPTREEMQERYDPWGHRDATSLYKEVSDSAKTEYHSDMYVCGLEDNRPMEGDPLVADRQPVLGGHVRAELTEVSASS
jgi:hypothetical protein